MKLFLSSNRLSYFQSYKFPSEEQVTFIDAATRVKQHQQYNIGYEWYSDLFSKTLFVNIEKRIDY